MKIPTKEQIDKAIAAYKAKLEKKEKELTKKEGKEKFKLELELSDLYKDLNPHKALHFAQEAQKFSNLTNKERAATSFQISKAYLRMGNKKAAISQLHNSLNLFKKNGAQTKIAQISNIIGSIYRDFSEMEKAISYTDKAMQINKEIKNKKGIVKSLVYKGHILNNQNKYGTARKKFEEALKISKQIRPSYQTGVIYQGLGQYYFLTSQYKKATDMFTKAFNFFYKKKDWFKVAANLHFIGNACFRLNKYDKCKVNCSLSLYLFKKFDNTEKMGHLYQAMGNVYYELGKFEKSLELRLKSLTMTNKLGDKVAKSKTLNNIGNSYTKLGDLKNGLEYFLKSLEIKRELGVKSGIANSLNNIGCINYTLGNYDKALEYYKESEKIKREIGDERSRANSLNNIALIYLYQKEYTKALEYYKKALKIVENLNLSKMIGIVTLNMGEVYVQKENFNKAKKYYKKSIAIFEEIGDNSILVRAKICLAKVHARQSDYEKGEKLLLSVIDLVEEINSPEIKLDFYKVAAYLYKRKNDFENAYKYYKKFIETKETLESKETKEKISELEAKYENEKKEKQIEQLKYENKIEKMRNEIADRVKERLEKEVKLRTKELEQSRRQYRDLIEKANDGIIILQNNRIKMFNKKFQKMLQFKPEKYGNALFTDFIPKKFHSSFQKKFDSENTSSKLEEIFLITKDESKINVELSLREVEYEGKEAKLMIIRDITQRKLADQKMIYAETLSGIGELAGGFAHEIKNPLTSINAAVQLLQSNYELEEEIDNYLDIIKKNTKKANVSVDNLSKFAKPRSAELEKLDLSYLLETVLTLLKGKMRSNNIQVKMQGLEDCPKIWGDHIYLQSAFINILLNAIQACEEEGKITITCDCDDDFLSLRFKDNGIGISQKEKDKIFDPFFTTKKDGSGLGLSMVQKVIHEHKGKINVEGEKGVGTEIEVHFPLNGEQILDRKDEQYEELDLNS